MTLELKVLIDEITACIDTQRRQWKIEQSDSALSAHVNLKATRDRALRIAELCEQGMKMVDPGEPA